MLHHKLTPSNTQGQRTHAHLALVEGSEGYYGNTPAPDEAHRSLGRSCADRRSTSNSLLKKEDRDGGRLERNNREIWRREWRSGGRPAPPLTAGEEGGGLESGVPELPPPL
jgi:hypothetical protein